MNRIQKLVFFSSLMVLHKIAAAAASQSCNYDGQVYLSTLQNKGVGYTDGYSTLGAFLSPQMPRNLNFHPFFDLRVHRFNKGRVAANAGFGIRYACSNTAKMFGGNLFYDYRKTSENLNQLGAGFEMWSSRYDVRVNGYLPIGNRITPRRHEFYMYDGGYTLDVEHYQKALPGADAEISTAYSKWKPKSNIDFYGAIGPYYYHCHPGSTIVGAQARAGLTFFKDVLRIEGRTSYDSTFHGIVQGLAMLSLPFGKNRRMKDADSGDLLPGQDYTQIVQRKEIIVNNRTDTKVTKNY